MEERTSFSDTSAGSVSYDRDYPARPRGGDNRGDQTSSPPRGDQVEDRRLLHFPGRPQHSLQEVASHRVQQDHYKLQPQTHQERHFPQESPSRTSHRERSPHGLTSHRGERELSYQATEQQHHHPQGRPLHHSPEGPSQSGPPVHHSRGLLHHSGHQEVQSLRTSNGPQEAAEVAREPQAVDRVRSIRELRRLELLKSASVSAAGNNSSNSNHSQEIICQEASSLRKVVFEQEEEDEDNDDMDAEIEMTENYEFAQLAGAAFISQRGSEGKISGFASQAESKEFRQATSGA